MKNHITIVIFLLAVCTVQAQSLNQKLAMQVKTIHQSGDTVPSYHLYIFSDFRHPIQSDTLKEGLFLQEWNQYIVYPGDPAFTFKRTLPILSHKDSVEKRYKFLLQDGAGLGVGTKYREESRRFFIQYNTCYYLKPEAVFMPYFIYMGDSVSENPNKKLYRGGNSCSITGREIIVIGGNSYWFLKNGVFYTGAGLDSNGKVYYKTVQDYLNTIDSDYARWLNSRTEANKIPPELREKIANSIQADYGKTINMLSQEETMRCFSVSSIRIYLFFPFPNEEF